MMSLRYVVLFAFWHWRNVPAAPSALSVGKMMELYNLLPDYFVNAYRKIFNGDIKLFQVLLHFIVGRGDAQVLLLEFFIF